MPISKSDVEAALSRVNLPDGKSLMAHDLVRALRVEDDVVRFVIEAPNAEVAQAMGPLRDAAERVVAELPGVRSVSVALTAHGPAKKPEAPPSLKIGGHPKPQEGPVKPVGWTGSSRLPLARGRGQVDGEFQSRRCAGPAGPPGGAFGCGYIRSKPAADDGGEQAPRQP